MSTARTNNLQTLDSSYTIPILDIASKSQLANSSNPTLGAALIGYKGGTVASTLDALIDQKIVHADDPIYGGDIVAAAAAVGDNTTFIIRQPYTLTAPLRFVGKTNVIVTCVGAGSLNGSRTAFTFPTVNARGILHFDNCINPIAYRVNILGARTARPSDVLQDGDAGIEYYQCTSPTTLECKVNQVLTWGIIHVSCTNTKCIDNTLTNMTRQSGIGHATVTGALCRGNYINYSGLYGIEVEGLNNSDVTVVNNNVRNCLKGIAVIGQINTCEIKNNTISLCTYLVQLDANGLSNTQVGTSVTGNRTYDGVFHYYLNDTTFVDVTNNTSLGRVSSAFIPQRQFDQVVSVISTTAVLILDSSTGTILVGDVHSYTEGVSRTVQAVTTQSDPTYGSCWRVTYTTPSTAIGFGSFFMRNTTLSGAGSWMYMSGTRNSNVNVFGNSINAPIGFGLNLNGTMNSLRWGANRMVGAAIGYFAGDSTPITNSSIMCKRGDIQQPSTSIAGGASPQKIIPSLVGETRTAVMLSPNKPIVLATNGSSLAFRLRLNLYGSTKTGSTGNAIVSVNGTTVSTIPVSSLGTTLVQVDVPLALIANTYTINLADTFGDMTFQSAAFELHTAEV